ncbi:MAG: CoA transferase [Comamonas sp.]|jgi:crotonobetainyl-CoA:carnitine CoA-transferase CaiB-like acyl-CoA transferase|uniref:CoA transferase n=1 Tax=Comamonas sp. TaxID=34028 RepID=UPI002821FC5C|nr:CoA transferase [Comamonas sp.]MDR0214117.1 CoA transferase [Comamonas sp.]
MNTTSPALSSTAVLDALWRGSGLNVHALDRVHLMGSCEHSRSSFAVGAAAQAGVAAAALAATEIGAARQPGLAPQGVSVNMEHVLAETTGYFTLDDMQPEAWSPLSGLYTCGAAIGQPGWVRIHANFDHHRDGALRMLGLPPGSQTSRQQVAQALHSWNALDFEAQATEAGLVVAAVRSMKEWEAHPQSIALRAQPLISITQLDAGRSAAPRAWPAIASEALPLEGLRVLDLTRILAGPVTARTLAAYGADVLMVNAPHLPNIEAIADLSRGKRSALLDLRTADGMARMRQLLDGAHVFLQGYRPGSLQALGLGAETVARMAPGIVCASLSAYGRSGPWGDKRGFDSLVQTVSGMNLAEAEAFGDLGPRALPMQLLDYGAGFLLALGVQAALLRQATLGGTWHVEVSLARVAQWLVEMGRVSAMQQAEADHKTEGWQMPFTETVPSGFGELCAVRPSAELSRTPARLRRPSVRPGTDEPCWLA